MDRYAVEIGLGGPPIGLAPAGRCRHAKAASDRRRAGNRGTGGHGPGYSPEWRVHCSPERSPRRDCGAGTFALEINQAIAIPMSPRLSSKPKSGSSTKSTSSGHRRLRRSTSASCRGRERLRGLIVPFGGGHAFVRKGFERQDRNLFHGRISARECRRASIRLRRRRRSPGQRPVGLPEAGCAPHRP